MKWLEGRPKKTDWYLVVVANRNDATQYYVDVSHYSTISKLWEIEGRMLADVIYYMPYPKFPPSLTEYKENKIERLLDEIITLNNRVEELLQEVTKSNNLEEK